MRVSCDVAPWWSAPGDPGFAEAASSSLNAARASLLRAPLHRRLWINDPDCLLLRHPDESRSAAQRRLAADAIARAGGFTMLSDDLSSFGSAEWDEVARVRAGLPAAEAPLTLVDPFADPLGVMH